MVTSASSSLPSRPGPRPRNVRRPCDRPTRFPASACSGQALANQRHAFTCAAELRHAPSQAPAGSSPSDRKAVLFSNGHIVLRGSQPPRAAVSRSEQQQRLSNSRATASS